MAKYFVAYGVVWILSVFWFWFSLGSIDPMGYTMLCLYVVNPLAIGIAPFLLVREKCANKKALLFPVFAGLLYMLLSYVTFDLLNMITYKSYTIHYCIVDGLCRFPYRSFNRQGDFSKPS